MSKEESQELKEFLGHFPKNLQDLALQLRSMVWAWYPDTNELIYDNYNALAFGWSITDKLSHTFCTMALYSSYLHFGFYDGKGILDPEKLLLGKGNQYRYIIVHDFKSFPATYIKKLVNEAYLTASVKLALDLEKSSKGRKYMKNNNHPKGMTIVKSRSPKKRRPDKA
ncbi:MAG: hypothetical protein ABIR66_04500 [Saprospiraceae bacterium]